MLHWLRLPLFLSGIGLFFINERYLGSEPYAIKLRIAVLALCVLGTLIAVLLSIGMGATRKQELVDRCYRYCALWQLMTLAGLGTYLGYIKVLGDAPSPDSPASKVLLAAWLLLIMLGFFLAIGIEWSVNTSLESSAQANDFAEPKRVARAGASTLGVGLILGFLVCINYAASNRNISRDWSYLKIRTPSESTEKMVIALTQPIEISLFYPQSNEVHSLIKEYFSVLEKKQPLIKVSLYDKDMNPVKAEADRVQRNGQIVLDLKGKKARIETGLTLVKARKTLKEIDKEFQKAFLEISAARKTAYFTRGHGEMSWIGDAGDNPLRSIKGIEGYLRAQNYNTRLFGIAEGSATAIPDDASVVIIAGPTDSFVPEEVAALKSYYEKGGKLMVLLDVQGPSGDTLPNISKINNLTNWLAELGVQFIPTPLANDKNHVSMTRTDADKWFLFTNVFTSHESVLNLARNDERFAILLYSVGYFTVTPEKGRWKTFETVRSIPDTYNDENRNFKMDGEEKKASFVIGVVVEPKDAPTDQKSPRSRLVALSDASVISDALASNSQGNVLYFADSLKWLVGDTQFSGEIAGDDDIKIRHTNSEDVKWFYGSVAVVPLLVLGAGFVATKRRKKLSEPDEKVQENAKG